MSWIFPNKGHLHHTAIPVQADSTIFMVPGLFWEKKDWSVGFILRVLHYFLSKRIHRGISKNARV